MSKKLLTSLFATCACVALAAQTPAPATSSPSQSTPAAQSRDQSKADTLTVAGCVQRNAATPGASGAVGTSGATASSFILSSAMKPTGTSGASQPSSAEPIASSYRLEADDSKLSPHVGHKVEITGTVDKAMASTPASPTASTAATAPILKVESVKMVAASCTP